MRDRAYILDTSVVAEYLDVDSPYGEMIEELYERLGRGEVEGYLTAATLSEILYVSSRIYREAGSDSPNEDAMRLIQWLMNHPHIRVVDLTPEICLRAGELRKEMHISLIDCLVIAAGEAMEVKSLFLKPEREFEKYMERLREHGVRFLTELRG